MLSHPLVSPTVVHMCVPPNQLFGLSQSTATVPTEKSSIAPSSASQHTRIPVARSLASQPVRPSDTTTTLQSRPEHSARRTRSFVRIHSKHTHTHTYTRAATATATVYRCLCECIRRRPPSSTSFAVWVLIWFGIALRWVLLLLLHFLFVRRSVRVCACVHLHAG